MSLAPVEDAALLWSVWEDFPTQIIRVFSNLLRKVKATKHPARRTPRPPHDGLNVLRGQVLFYIFWSPESLAYMIGHMANRFSCYSTSSWL